MSEVVGIKMTPRIRRVLGSVGEDEQVWGYLIGQRLGIVHSLVYQCLATLANAGYMRSEVEDEDAWMARGGKYELELEPGLSGPGREVSVEMGPRRRVLYTLTPAGVKLKEAWRDESDRVHRVARQS